jgi:hypothetical protein
MLKYTLRLTAIYTLSYAIAYFLTVTLISAASKSR